MPLAPPSENSSIPLEPRAPTPLTRSDAEKLGERIQQQAAVIAQATCELLLMVGEFDARGGLGWFVGLKSTAHWLSWSCSMAPGTAREHVRVARALPAMPLTVAEFRAGRLSYSKVREMTRVADQVDEALLVDLARAMTASQLALAIASFRAIDGSRLGQDVVRQASWRVRDDGMVEIRAVLPAEAGAEVITALDLALSRDGTAPPQADPAAEGPSIEDSASSGSSRSIPHADQLSAEEAAERAAEITTTPTLEQRRADALQNIARTFLDAEPDDRSGEDRHLVVVQVSAEALTQDVPAGTPPDSRTEPAADGADVADADTAAAELADAVDDGAVIDVPAGTPENLRSARHGPARDAHRRAPRLHRQGRDLDHRCRWRDPSSGQVTALGVAGSASRPASSRHHLQLPRLSPVAASRRPSRGPVVRGRSHRHRGPGPAVQASPRDGPRRRIAAGTCLPLRGAPGPALRGGRCRRTACSGALARHVRASLDPQPRHRDRRCRCRCRPGAHRRDHGRRRLPSRGLCGRPLHERSGTRCVNGRLVDRRHLPRRRSTQPLKPPLPAMSLNRE